MLYWLSWRPSLRLDFEQCRNVSLIFTCFLILFLLNSLRETLNFLKFPQTSYLKSQRSQRRNQVGFVLKSPLTELMKPPDSSCDCCGYNLNLKSSQTRCFTIRMREELIASWLVLQHSRTALSTFLLAASRFTFVLKRD